MSAGIRQGCPLSPLLFATVVDVLLRRLTRLLPSSIVRAYADDVAIVVDDLFHSAAVLARIFDDFEQISGLALNLHKTFVVPLFRDDLAAIHRQLAEGCPGWGGIKVQYHATYLGFVLGPERGERSWDGPLRKYIDRCTEWGSLGLGMQLSVEAYLSYIFPVLQYIAQLELPPSAWVSVEETAIRTLFPGPREWILAQDLQPMPWLLDARRHF